MEKVTSIKTIVLAVTGGLGGLIAQALGGWGNDIQALLIFMGIDFAMGLAIAAFWQQSNKSESGALNSISAWKGLVRKGVTLLVVIVANQLDVLLGLQYIRTAVIIAFCADELISIVENLGIMGIPLPAVISNAIEILKKKSEKTETSKEESEENEV